LLIYQYRTTSFLELEVVLSAIFPTPKTQHITHCLIMFQLQNASVL